MQGCTDGPAMSPGARRVVDDPALRRLQRKHFVIFDILPIPATLVAFATARSLHVGTPEVVVFLLMWAATGLSVSAGYHRFFTHRSFKANRVVAAALAIVGQMAGQGPVISWVAMHRRHHELTDRDGDVHSPNLHGTSLRGRLRGLAHAHFTWMAGHPYPNVVQYAPDLVRERLLVAINRRYYYCAIAGVVLPALLCAALRGEWIGLLTGALWGGVVRMFILEHSIWALNSFGHMFGTRRFRARDESRNIALLAPFVFGEPWHNNHHAFPASASFGLAWYRIDPGYWFICLLALTGLAREVNVPTKAQMQALERRPLATR